MLKTFVYPIRIIRRNSLVFIVALLPNKPISRVSSNIGHVYSIQACQNHLTIQSASQGRKFHAGCRPIGWISGNVKILTLWDFSAFCLNAPRMSFWLSRGMAVGLGLDQVALEFHIAAILTLVQGNGPDHRVVPMSQVEAVGVPASQA